MPVIMRRNPLGAFAFLMLMLALFSGALWAASPSFCASLPRLHWLSAEEVELRLRERGYHLVRLRMGDDKCYAAVVRDSGGRLRDFLMHPVTAEIVRDRSL
jgi:hypothetical protein